MLHVIWFVVLSLIGIVFAYLCPRYDRPARDAAGYLGLGSIMATVCALYAIDPVLIEPAYQWLKHVLPEGHTDINILTAGTLVLVACAVYAVAPIGIALIVDDRAQERERQHNADVNRTIQSLANVHVLPPRQ